MSQNTLIEKIQQNAQAEVDVIVTAQLAEVARIESETEKSIANLRQAHAEALKKKKAQVELVAISRAKQAGNIALQAAKRSAIDAIFDTAFAELRSLEPASYVAFYTKRCQATVPRDAEVEVVLAPAERQTETQQILAASGLSGAVTVDKTVDAGLIVKTTSGVYDISLNRLFSQQRPDLEMMVVNKVAA